MRKPRDYDAKLKALTDKARQLKARKQSQFGELVMATGADTLGIEELAGALLGAAGADAATREAWRKRGATFFQGERQSTGHRTDGEPNRATADNPRPPLPGIATGAA